MLFVDLGTDISAGFVSDGRLHRGAQGIAGRSDMFMSASRTRRICGCGNVGCLQTVAGCDAIAREGLRAANEGRSRLLGETLADRAVTVADIGTAARLGDPFSADLLARCGRLIGTVLATLANILNPSIIVLGGELAQTGDICLAAIREGIYGHSQPLLTRDLSIVRSRMGRSSGLVGAAAVAVTNCSPRIPGGMDHVGLAARASRRGQVARRRAARVRGRPRASAGARRGRSRSRRDGRAFASHRPVVRLTLDAAPAERGGRDGTGCRRPTRRSPGTAAVPVAVRRARPAWRTAGHLPNRPPVAEAWSAPAKRPSGWRSCCTRPPPTGRSGRSRASRPASPRRARRRRRRRLRLRRGHPGRSHRAAGAVRSPTP